MRSPGTNNRRCGLREKEHAAEFSASRRGRLDGGRLMVACRVGNRRQAAVNPRGMQGYAAGR